MIRPPPKPPPFPYTPLFRPPAWEAAQLILGLAIPPLLVGHIAATRLNWWLLGTTIGYERIVAGLWADPWAALRQCRSEEHTSELQSLRHLVCRLLLEKKKRT